MSVTGSGSAFESLSDEQVLKVMASALAERPRLAGLLDAVTRSLVEAKALTTDTGEVFDAEIVEDANVAAAAPNELEREWNARQEAGLQKLAEIRKSMGSKDS